jgi:RsiW-degrading membrane proteinase PrsW (M82 family)
VTTAPSPAHVPPPAPARSDRLLITLGIVSVALAIGLIVVDGMHLLPNGIGVILVVAAVSIGIRVLFRLRAKRSSALSNPAVMAVVTYVMLGISLVSACIDLGVALQRHDVGHFVLDVVQHSWTLLLIMIVAIPARTMGWRSILGMLLTGILGVSSLALLVGTPVVTALGGYNEFAAAVYAPITEELLKALPVAIIALIAARNTTSRPSAVDFGILGYLSGMGFALIEDATYGRVVGGWDQAEPLSHLYPSMFTTAGFVSQGEVVAGHAVWSAFIGLGLGFGILYRRRFRFAWIAIPATVLLAIVEHCLGNVDLPPVVLQVLVAKGTLVAILFPIALIGLAVFERRPLKRFTDLRFGLLMMKPGLVAQRAHLADLQRSRRVAAPAVPVAAVAASTEVGA